MKKFDKFKDSSLELEGVFGGMRKSEGTGECAGTGCKTEIGRTESGVILWSWDDIECGDTTIGKNSGLCDPIA